MSRQMPFLKSNAIRSMASLFIGIGDILSRLSPYMGLTLKQSGITGEYKLNARSYLAITFFMSLVSFLLVTLIVSGIFYLGGKQNIVIGPILGAITGVIMYLYMILYPKSIVNKRVKNIDRNLLFVLRNILIQLRSGVPVFNTLIAVSSGDYGPISQEFKNAVERVNSGQSMVDALEELAIRNPSLYFRRALWQIVNGLKSGSDIGDHIADVIKSLSQEQLIEIRRYRSVLNPLAMVYMMVAVIIPSLGITMLIVLSSFPGMEAIGNENTFWILLATIVVLQFIFMGLIKSKRPNLMGG